MSTLIQLIDRARAELVEPSPGFWSQTEFKNWCNEAHRDICEVLRLPKADAPVVIATVDGTELYTIAADFETAVLVEIEDVVGSGYYRAIRAESLAHRVPSKGTPAAYFIWNQNKLGLIPVPDEVRNIRVWYAKAPTTLSADADATVIPEKYEHLLVKYMCAQAKRKEGDNAFQTYASDYMAGRADAVTKETEDNQSQNFAVVRYVG